MVWHVIDDGIIVEIAIAHLLWISRVGILYLHMVSFCSRLKLVLRVEHVTMITSLTIV
jgi:hypothetical protein